MEFQIKQTFGPENFAWIYFESESRDIETLKAIAVSEMKKDWEKVKSSKSLYLLDPVPPMATITVAEYARGKKVKNGITFKTNWR